MADVTEPLITEDLDAADAVTMGVTQALTTESLDASESSLGGISFLTLESVTLSDDYNEWKNVVQALITDDIEISDAANDSYGAAATDILLISDGIVDATQNLTDSITEQLEVADAPLHIQVQSVTETLLISDASIPPAFSDSITESLEASDSATSYGDQTQFISEQLEVSDSTRDVGFGWTDTVSETLYATDDVVGEARSVWQLVSDPLEISDSVLSYASATDLLGEVIEINDFSATLPNTINSLVTEELLVQDFVYSANPNALAWVMNLETGAPWLYSNFDFTSVVEQAGMLFGASQDGLYLLQGETDDGTEIASELKTGFIDFGTENKKRLPYIYFGYTGGELECDVETFETHEYPDDIYTYGLEEREASAPRNNRIALGKGLVSRYWRFTIRNLAGSAFKVYDTLADVVNSKRRL